MTDIHELGEDITPLEATPPLYFLTSHHQ